MLTFSEASAIEPNSSIVIQNISTVTRRRVATPTSPSPIPSLLDGGPSASRSPFPRLPACLPFLPLPHLFCPLPFPFFPSPLSPSPRFLLSFLPFLPFSPLSLS